MAGDDYKTVQLSASDEFIEKKSRFIGHCAPISTEEDALAFISGVRSRFWDATHNVSAYLLRAGGKKRCSDDGEPQGTAGVPVLDVLEKEGVTDLVVVVTRYFGGTLLGAGGLVRAYSHACGLALHKAGIVRMQKSDVLEMTMAYPLYGRVQYVLSQAGAVVENAVFGEKVTVLAALPQAQTSAFQAAVNDAANGGCEMRLLEKRFMPVPVDGAVEEKKRK